MLWHWQFMETAGLEPFSELPSPSMRLLNAFPPSLHRVTRPKGNVSSIICLSQHISEVRDVPLSVFIDKSPVPTTKVFYYRENPTITAVRPDCSFDR